MEAIDRQPHLTAARLHLRPLRPEDWEQLYAVACDPKVWELHPQRDRWREPVFREYFRQALASGGALAAIDPVHGRIIGCSRYDLTRAGPGELEIGWTFLSRVYWGGAMNSVLKRMMLEHAFQYVDRVIFVVGELNLRSRSAMEKIGARLTGRTLEPTTGSLGLHVVYAIDRDAFYEGPLKPRPLAVC